MDENKKEILKIKNNNNIIFLALILISSIIQLIIIFGWGSNLSYFFGPILFIIIAFSGISILLSFYLILSSFKVYFGLYEMKTSMRIKLWSLLPFSLSLLNIILSIYLLMTIYA